jgi:DNA-binding response OmpR family regulator
MRILLVEDDALLGDATMLALRQRGHAVDWVSTAEDAEAACRASEFDAMLLDIGLPGRSGLELLRDLRNRHNMTPVLILTARDRVEQRVAGLDAGADDYLTKPFDIAEVDARLRALVRRRSGQASPVLTVGPIALDPAARCVTLEGRPVAISAREFAVLHLLMERPGHMFDRAAIEERLYDWDSSVESNAVEVYISRLRKKFGKSFIKTVRGMGYVLENVA